MEVTSWGRYPRVEASVSVPTSVEAVRRAVRADGEILPRGLGRSYGDSALAGRLLDLGALDHLLDFDPDHGILTCAAGASLYELQRFLVPRGWFLPVVPGTRFVTVGGAIASDIHGKNHHVHGSFGDHVRSMEMVLADGSRVVVDRELHGDLFRATCGGMGLTGIVVAATIQLLPIRSSEIVETTHRARNLAHVLALFEEHTEPTYSVAWIDCLATGDSLGRSVLMLGEHAPDGPLRAPVKPPIPVPIDFPPWCMNRATMGAFNQLYYAKAGAGTRTHRKSFESFFHPLDAVADWNRLYGKQGFLQHQFVIPKEEGPEALASMLGLIARSGKASFLAVLKVFGPGNDHFLSFPFEGYTLALDFQADRAAFELLDRLDERVRHHRGRLYLTKDARMSREMFAAGYPGIDAFQAVRARYGALGKFVSAQSRRLGLD
ncbi:MAG: FAD-dependent oxidoreductase [Armatimonadota bacterium]